MCKHVCYSYSPPPWCNFLPHWPIPTKPDQAKKTLLISFKFHENTTEERWETSEISHPPSLPQQFLCPCGQKPPPPLLKPVGKETSVFSCCHNYLFFNLVLCEKVGWRMPGSAMGVGAHPRAAQVFSCWDMYDGTTLPSWNTTLIKEALEWKMLHLSH